MNPSMNRIIPVIGSIVLLIAVVIGLRAFSDDPNEPSMFSEVPEAPSPDADTPADTVRSLSGQVAQLLDQTKTLTEENQRLRDENAAALGQEQRIETRLRAALQKDRAEERNRDQTLLSSLTDRIEQLSGKLAAQQTEEPPTGDWQDIPVGFGYGEEAAAGTIHWIEALDAPAAGPALAEANEPVAGSLLQNDPVPTGHRADNEAQATNLRGESDSTTPVYTIPANATLLGSTALTALVGRIPVGGQVQDPMPFKALIGAENLAANGHRIPGLEGMVISGYTIGDWTLACVRGTVLSATFVFEDGQVVTFGEKEQRSSGGRDRDAEAIGWISDRFGVPCVSGKRITNAPQFLSQRIGITALEAAAAAAAASQTTTVVGVDAGGTSTSSVTGDQGKYILGQSVAGGAREINQWLLERQAQSFDAVFVAAGEALAVHLDVTLPIDYDPRGRKLDYRAGLATGGAYGYLD